MEIKIRPAVGTDAPAIAGLCRQLDRNPEQFVFDKSLFYEAVLDSHTHIFVAIVDEQIVGMATLSRILSVKRGRLGYVNDVVTDEKYLGRGVMRKLVERYEAEAAHQKIVAIDHTCSRVGPQVAWKKLGYEPRDTQAFFKRLKTNRPV